MYYVHIIYTLHLNPIIYYYIILIVYNLRLGHTKIKPYAEQQSPQSL